MEAFSHLVDRTHSASLLSSFLAGSVDGALIVVSHLLFANDALIYLFFEGNLMAIFYLHSVLVSFAAASGSQINFEKSELVPMGEGPCILELADI